MNRTRLLPILAAVVLVPAAFLVLTAQKPADRTGVATTTTAKAYTGKSVDGNFQAALDDAIQQAEAAISKTGADMRFEWTMGAVKGTRGGIAGTREVTVEIKLP